MIRCRPFRWRRTTLMLSQAPSPFSFSSLAVAAVPVFDNPTTTTTPNSSSCPSSLLPLSPPEIETLVLKQYRHGKFQDILASVVSNPSVLLAACRNLYSSSSIVTAAPSFPPDSVARLFSIEEVSRELKEQVFDVDSCCVNVIPSRKKGTPRILPNLKLKVVMEAIRMVLEVIYDKRFFTFSYGGRVGMGRHTAVRYLKTSVKNPSWWFTVGFRRERFGYRQVRRLVESMESKISDSNLTGLIEKLLVSEAVVLQIGGFDMGRGFPQESGLCSILMNIYFDGFDHVVQDLRLEVKRKNPRILVQEVEKEERAFHGFQNPMRLYSVRYLDEILLITSASKVFTLEVRDKLVKFLEESLYLRVDKQRTEIHSAVTEKIGFMGMELQAVPPSVLHPPMSEKAIRAWKKYLKRKAAKVLELKNARETRRKITGLQIFNHVFQKLKESSFDFEFQIEKEVREVFRSWADDVVKEFLSSKDERFNLHRALSSPEFLRLKKIRDQLPTELVDSYDQFGEKLDKYLMPHNSTKAFEDDSEEAEGRCGDSEDVEEEKKYSKRMVEDLTTLCMRVEAPIMLVRKAVKMVGFTNLMGRPRPINLLCGLEDSSIIKWYAGVGKRWLDYYCCCHNFRMVKTVVNYHLRFSCFLTLAKKHESTKIEAIRHYTKDLKVSDENGQEQGYFPTEREIKMMNDKNLSDPRPVDGALNMILVRLASSETSCPCAGHFCERTDVALYRVRLLQNRLNVDPLNEKKWVSGLGAVDECLNKKCFALCLKHVNDLYLGVISLQNIDCTSFVDVQEPLVTNIMWRNLIVQALYQVVSLLLLFSGRSIMRLKNDNRAHADLVKNTFVFNTFVLCQVLIVEFLGKFASTVKLKWQLWIVSIVIAFISWPLAVVGKLIPVPDTPIGVYCTRRSKRQEYSQGIDAQ